MDGLLSVDMSETSTRVKPTVHGGLQLCRRTHIIGLNAGSAHGGGIQSMRTDHCPLSLQTHVSPETPVWRHCLSFPQCAPPVRWLFDLYCARVLRERSPGNQPNRRCMWGGGPTSLSDLGGALSPHGGCKWGMPDIVWCARPQGLRTGALGLLQRYGPRSLSSTPPPAHAHAHGGP